MAKATIEVFNIKSTYNDRTDEWTGKLKNVLSTFMGAITLPAYYPIKANVVAQEMSNLLGGKVLETAPPQDMGKETIY